MGQKVNPIGMRLQVNRTWDSRWYADTKDYGDLLLEDLRMREFIRKECAQAGVARVIIERPHKKCRVTIHTARPGVIIGKKGADIEVLRKKLAAMTTSGLRTSTMFRCNSDVVIAASFLRKTSMSAPFLPMITPGRAVWIVTRHFL